MAATDTLLSSVDVTGEKKERRSRSLGEKKIEEEDLFCGLFFFFFFFLGNNGSSRWDCFIYLFIFVVFCFFVFAGYGCCCYVFKYCYHIIPLLTTAALLR